MEWISFKNNFPCIEGDYLCKIKFMGKIKEVVFHYTEKYKGLEHDYGELLEWRKI